MPVTTTRPWQARQQLGRRATKRASSARRRRADGPALDLEGAAAGREQGRIVGRWRGMSVARIIARTVMHVLTCRARHDASRAGRRTDPRGTARRPGRACDPTDNTHFSARVVSAAFAACAPCSATSWSTARWASAWAARSTPCRIEALTPGRTAPRGTDVDKLQITGGVPLEGEVRISGAKNATLPILAGGAAGRRPGDHRQRAAPARRDHHDRAARPHGRDGHGRRAHAHRGRRRHASRECFAPYELVKTMRASILVLGRCWRASAAPTCRCRAAAPSARGR